ncbi:MAG: fumarate hydratase [Armatimonadota bacterium]
MRKIESSKITQTVKDMFLEVSFNLPGDVLDKIKEAAGKEESELGREVLDILVENAKISTECRIPLCQDCGFAVIYVKIGDKVEITGENINKAVSEGVKQAYEEGYLRKSIVYDPVYERKNTKDNTPPLINIEIIEGENIEIYVLPKGGGSENMSALRMLKPAQGENGIVDFVSEVVKSAGSNPCPPVIVGVGIGGTSDKAMSLAKKALLRPLGAPSKEEKFARLEAKLLEKINNLGIGPQGFGGRTTALAVHIEIFPCHIASMPVGVNIQCHSARWKKEII